MPSCILPGAPGSVPPAATMCCLDVNVPAHMAITHNWEHSPRHSNASAVRESRRGDGLSWGRLSFHGGPRSTRLHNTLLYHDYDGSDHETDRGIARRHFELIRAAMGTVWRVHIGRWTRDSNLAVLRRRYDLQPGLPDIALAWRIGRVENLLRSNRRAVALLGGKCASQQKIAS